MSEQRPDLRGKVSEEDGSVEGASVEGASVEGASVEDASLEGASVDGASTEGISKAGGSNVGEPRAVGTKKRGGCFRSCLIMSLVLLLIGVVGSVGVYFAGRSYLQRQIPAWKAQYPEIGLVFDLLQLSDETEAVDDPLKIGGERLTGVNDKSRMPDDLPLYPDPLVETYNVGEEQAIGFQRVAAVPTAVVGHLQEMMAQNGWELVDEQETDFGHLFVWSKAERTCRLEVAPARADDETELWVRCDGL